MTSTKARELLRGVAGKQDDVHQQLFFGGGILNFQTQNIYYIILYIYTYLHTYIYIYIHPSKWFTVPVVSRVSRTIPGIYHSGCNPLRWGDPPSIFETNPLVDSKTKRTSPKAAAFLA